MRDNKGRFVSGGKAWNKGLKGYSAGYSETRPKFGTKENHFRYRPIGSTYVCSRGYVRIKISDNKGDDRRLLHKENWKKSYGEYPPKGMKIIFIDGNKLNCDVSNLMLIGQDEIMRNNSFNNYPDGLKQCIKMTKKLERMINEKQY